MGNEHRGASEEAIALADGFLKIPMYGFTESYNVSVAAALIGLPIIQKVRESEVYWGLTEIQKRDLYFEWIWHSIKNPDKVYAEWKNNR
jgi:tRNA (guanosine-2'-O-)-methyltransferase